MEKNLSYNTRIVILLFAFLFVSSRLNSQSASPERPPIKTIVIDAGHGGKDPGCHGASANEKTVCLSIALKLGDMIKKKYPDIKVAERENSTIYLEADKGEKYKEFDLSPDAIIARQIQLSVFLDQSISFADKLQKEFSKLGRYNRGVKQAGFLVLYKTTMPSVLIETGFLTNPSEEKFLGDTIGQRKMASSMLSAFEKYKNELEGIDGKTVAFNPEVTTAKTEENPVPSEEKDKVIFRVQIETSETKVATTSSKFKGLKVFEYRQDNLFKYTVGSFPQDFAAANRYKAEMREQGFQHAFVVAFVNGERINLEKAIKLAEK